MRKVFYALAILIPLVALVVAAGFSFTRHTGVRAAATCLPTGYTDPREGVLLNAAVIDPPGTYSSTLDATGCDIGVYYGPGVTGTVSQATIFGAKYYGVVNNGATVTITHSAVHDIGDNPFDGVQRGLAIYFSYNSGATGEISYNTVSRYQKNGITVTGSSDSAKILHNTVLGMGPVNYIAQNGIEVGAGAKGIVDDNRVSGNSYTGAGGASSGGILVFGGACYGSALTLGTQVINNVLTGNDVGIYLSNLDVDSNSNCVPPTTPTNDVARGNTIKNNAVNNTSGYGAGVGYQAGVSENGDHDQIIKNTICGKGYKPATPPPAYVYKIDLTLTNNPVVKGNVSCDASNGANTNAQALTTPRSKKHLIVSVVR